MKTNIFVRPDGKPTPAEMEYICMAAAHFKRAESPEFKQFVKDFMKGE
jgi:hypothetical protein